MLMLTSLEVWIHCSILWSIHWHSVDQQRISVLSTSNHGDLLKWICNDDLYALLYLLSPLSYRLDISCQIPFSHIVNVPSTCHSTTALFCLEQNVIGNCWQMAAFKYLPKQAIAGQTNWKLWASFFWKLGNVVFFLPTHKHVPGSKTIPQNPYYSTSRAMPCKLSL